MPPPDRELRRLVADLAAASADDVEEILADLDDGQRARVRAMLADYLGEPVGIPKAPPPPEPPPPVVIAALVGLSPWLGARLARSVEPGLGISGRRRDPRADVREPFMTFSMTPTALAALQSAARDLQPAGEPAPVPSAPYVGWRERLARLVVSRR